MIVGLAHTAVCVADVDAAVAWYRDVLGLTVLSPPYRMEGEGSFPEADGPLCLLDQVLDAAKKGQTIQRYKGLGEMNPEQLWETAMNPESRELLRVELGDETDADEIFSRLMGDQVEPRREFIEQNALNVSSLDI